MRILNEYLLKCVFVFVNLNSQYYEQEHMLLNVSKFFYLQFHLFNTLSVWFADFNLNSGDLWKKEWLICHKLIVKLFLHQKYINTFTFIQGHKIWIFLIHFHKLTQRNRIFFSLISKLPGRCLLLDFYFFYWFDKNS